MKSIVGAEPLPIDIIVSSYTVDSMNDTKLTSIEGMAFNSSNGEAGGALVKLKDPSSVYWMSQFGETIHLTKWTIADAEAEFMNGYLICTFEILELPENMPSSQVLRIPNGTLQTATSSPTRTPVPTRTVAPTATPTATIDATIDASNGYVVKAGDTCSEIAKLLNTRLIDLRQANGLDERCLLAPGRVLKIP
jgi:hypothetical protein